MLIANTVATDHSRDAGHYNFTLSKWSCRVIISEEISISSHSHFRWWGVGVGEMRTMFPAGNILMV